MNTLMKKANGNGNMPATTFSGLVEKIFQDNVNRFFDDNFWGFNNISQNVNVPVNIRETDNSYELELVAPGLRKEDFKINLQREILTISFEHQEEQSQQAKEGGWVRKEYQAKSFTRSFNLDDAIDAGKISAQYTDGILHVNMPKKEGAQAVSRSIDIQ